MQGLFVQFFLTLSSLFLHVFVQTPFSDFNLEPEENLDVNEAWVLAEVEEVTNRQVFFAKLEKECPNLRKLGSSDLYETVSATGTEFSLSPELIFAVIAVESRCKPNARSSAGAIGLMQLMPRTAEWLGVKNPYSIKDNIFGGGKYISYLLDKFDGNVELALAAYNAGPTAVRKYRSIPPYRETRNYVKKVISIYKDLKPESSKV